ncbi:Subtilisin-like protease, fibronectin type-III domain [Dillenia turbinata]|uniref:Subtilisin-like protease, fibronectin type-III domain n=1 Tax=Dillenia turbinata TaxID=194707 RepID=A0AAN8V238_9MAGN
MTLFLCTWKIKATTYFYTVVSLILILNERGILHAAAADVKSDVYIAYMGKNRQQNDREALGNLHHETLTTVLGSKEASRHSMVYQYKHGLSGFAARLTKAQAQTLAGLSNVLQVIPSRLIKLKTTRSWDYLGLIAHAPTGLLHETEMGNDVIIGLIDTGIWPESEVFNDMGLGPIPLRWRGDCESGELFNKTVHCSRKLIGARYFIKGLEASYGQPYNSTEFGEYLSPRDAVGHGTHTSSTAAGSDVSNASFGGLAYGTVRGGASRARVAMYKACWNLDGGVCATADVLKAFDMAIHDGVDVLSLSLGSDYPLFSDVDVHDGINFGSFHAVTRGITVVCAAGNSGPIGDTVENTEPWILTVAASSMDRSFLAPITLGNNQTIAGQTMYTGNKTEFVSLVYPEVSDIEFPSYCNSLSPNDTSFAGKVVLCFSSDSSEIGMSIASWAVSSAGGVGVIVAKSPVNPSLRYSDNFPVVQVSYEIGTQILYYIRSTRHPKTQLMPTKTKVSKSIPTTVAYFSSRGPNSKSQAILKGDPTKIADPFDYGGGVINPNRAARPGLVYDMGEADYIQYLCSMGYNDSAISQLTEESISCENGKHSILNINLPSITIPNLKSSITISRTVTNVGPVNSTYNAIISPPLGITVSVKPRKLTFSSTRKSITFNVTVSSMHQVNAGYVFGSLTWTDGLHTVRSPISVRSEIIMSV